MIYPNLDPRLNGLLAVLCIADEVVGYRGGDDVVIESGPGGLGAAVSHRPVGG